MEKTMKDWVLATRPWSLTASAMPALLAISYVFYIRHALLVPIHWWQGVLALLGAVIFQVGGNLLNDYFDFIYKVDRADTYSSRTLVDGNFTPRSIFIFGVTSLLIGSAIGLYLLFFSGWHLLWIGVLGFLGAYFYNRLKYIALGDVVIFLIYGWLISLGVVYVMTGILIWQVLLVSSSAGLLIVGILHANNTRDILNDQKAHIHTQAMVLGVEASKRYFIILMVGAYLLLLFIILLGIVHSLCLLVFLTFPIALRLMKQMYEIDLNSLDKIKTLTESVAQLVMSYCLLFAISNFIAGFML
ncbi:MAG: prenyltransferase [Bacteroides sp.]|nr:prenyltransferase [Bacteroides sp.]